MQHASTKTKIYYKIKPFTAHFQQREVSYPEGDDGVENPPELARHGEVRQQDSEGEVPHDPARAPVYALPAASKEGASPSSGHAHPLP
jgi:hypothetical protein